MNRISNVKCTENRDFKVISAYWAVRLKTLLPPDTRYRAKNIPTQIVGVATASLGAGPEYRSVTGAKYKSGRKE